MMIRASAVRQLVRQPADSRFPRRTLDRRKRADPAENGERWISSLQSR